MPGRYWIRVRLFVSTTGENLGYSRLSSTVAGLKVEKSGSGVKGEGECEEAGVELLTRERRSLDILSVKKEAKLSASELVGKGEEDLRCYRLLSIARWLVRLPAVTPSGNSHGQVIYTHVP